MYLFRTLKGTGEFDYEIYKPKPVLAVSFYNGEAAVSSVSFYCFIFIE